MNFVNIARATVPACLLRSVSFCPITIVALLSSCVQSTFLSIFLIFLITSQRITKPTRDVDGIRHTLLVKADQRGLPLSKAYQSLGKAVSKRPTILVKMQAPITRLPAEILARIFLINLPSEEALSEQLDQMLYNGGYEAIKDERAPIVARRLTLVCRAWHHV